ncbi:MAG: pitrilysin family protein [Syntrophales bacterium]|nr:pitrilysin family protein [Syntrophales bacterium]
MFLRLFFVSVFVLLPALAAADNIYRSPDRLVYKPLHFNPPKAERVVLENGMILYFLEDHELPLVRLSAIIRTGYMYDPSDKSGLAELTATVMRTGGTEKIGGNAIDEKLEYVAASIEANTAMEHTNWSFSVLKKDINPVLDIFSQILMKPAFDENKLKTAKNLKIEELRRIQDDAQKLAFREFNRLLYRGDPRGRLPSITAVTGINRQDLERFHRQYYFPGNIMIAVSGDIKKAEVIEKLNAVFGKWAVSGKVETVPPPAGKSTAGIYYLVKDTTQSVIAAGQWAPSKKSGDYYSFETMNFMIGSGGFRSRIFQEIRTNRGLAYSVGSYYRTRMDYGVFGAYAMTKTASASEVLKLMKGILQQIKTSPPGEKEMERAQKSMINSYIFEFQTSQQIATQQMMLEYNRLPDDFLAMYCSRIEKLKADEIRNVAARYLHPDDMTVLILGTAEGYEHLKKQYPNIQKIKVNND